MEWNDVKLEGVKTGKISFSASWAADHETDGVQVKATRLPKGPPPLDTHTVSLSTCSPPCLSPSLSHPLFLTLSFSPSLSRPLSLSLSLTLSFSPSLPQPSLSPSLLLSPPLPPFPPCSLHALSTLQCPTHPHAQPASTHDPTHPGEGARRARSGDPRDAARGS